jgi:triphosphoribosyl-dephospho-CoA synthase
MDAAAQNGTVGNAVLQAVKSTKRLVGSNSNLGMILLLAPLAAAARHICLRDGVCQVLRQLGPQDARDVYAAIRLAEPSGLGEVDDMDIGGVPPDDLRAAMRAAAARDLIARQYAEDYIDVFDFVAPAIVAGQRQGWTLIESIVYTHVQTMNAFPDSLIARKCGIPTALESAARAGAVLDSGRPGDAAYWEALDDLDFWLRCDGHRRNPGTTADMISAGVFVGLRDGTLTPPYR